MAGTCRGKKDSLPKNYNNVLYDNTLKNMHGARKKLKL